MVRNLQITIVEAPATAVRSGTTALLPAASGATFGLGNPSGSEEGMVDPSNPDTPDQGMVDPNNPDGGSTGAYGAGLTTYVPVVTAVETTGLAAQGSCCCCKSEETTSKPERPGVTPRDYSGFVIVRTAAGVPLTYQSLWQLANVNSLTALKAVLELDLGAPAPAALAEPGLRIELRRPPLPQPDPAESDLPTEDEFERAGVLVSRPLIDRPPGRGEKGSPRARTLELIDCLETRAATSPFRPLHSLAAYWRVDLRPYPDRVEEVVDRFNALAEVDLAYRELSAVDPSFGAHYADDQAYLADAPVGISASWVLENLQFGPKSLRVCDVEQEWNFGHVDIPNVSAAQILYGENRVPDGATGFHGTAVLGQLAASGVNVDGVAAKVADFLLASHYRSSKADPKVTFPGTNGHVAAAIVNALISDGKPAGTYLQAGDVLLLEVQRGLRPTEIDAADFDAIRLASALGVIVVEPAGNGGFDLDAYVDPDTGASLRRGGAGFLDSGAVVVGAARSALPHNRAAFSNYGSRLDCFAWGDSVTSCGYGNLSGKLPTDYYTNTFSGTSSASPIVAGAAALVQALHVADAGFPLDPRAMRVVLADPATGTRQGSNVGGAIGVMPDLRRIVGGRLQLVPDVYMRRRIGDGGAQPYTGAEISSSPDILLCGAKITDPATHFGEGPRANVPAPGLPFDPATPRSLYGGIPKLVVRLRNRGGGKAEALVNLFASPAATLITPERWVPLDKPITVTDIAEGDLLTIGKRQGRIDASRIDSALGSLSPTGADAAVATSVWGAGLPPFSFLAVQRPTIGTPHVHGTESLLPPGPPYFDWAAYRRFLRGPGVAWRNAYSVVVGTSLPSPLSLAFLVAGTPDEGRYFDLEVLQRLPAGVKVSLTVPPALTAKLRQRQPWLADATVVANATAAGICLPNRSRTTIGPVNLAGGTCIPAAFSIAGSGSLENGHSLAIRQLWNGEEVGRITWWFVEKGA
jgi:serine protease